ncbi:hypothetical protein CSC80_15350 [Maribacter sp. 6B07]|uniref:RloB family protein n=1 Tax=Maribacter sp. 6B07 TaxID=2045442 RepID=UPI000C08107D|nr:RloB family protein [Maribacter sp. 6B07]PHN92338.1 hypothetical protein CSC80_15350 [Maribacter sp. 6B07]
MLNLFKKKMLNKRQIQRANKFRHLDEVGRNKKQRREEPKLNRRRASKTALPLILIACEGKNTEPSYFNQFELKSVEIEPKGDGYSHLSLVHWAEKLEKVKSYDEVWCVFDADPKPADPNWAHNFNNAIWTAERKNYHVGYAHQAFEYWLILHFEDHQGGSINRTDYNKKLNQLINPLGASFDGSGSKEVTPELFALLQGKDQVTGKPRVELAICRAKRIYDKHDHTNPAQEESSTNIFELVLRLINFDRDDSDKILIDTLCG